MPYATRTEAIAYLTARGVGTEFLALDETAQNAHLLVAHDLMERNIEWEGEPAATSQPDAFPRIGLRTRNGGDLDSTTVPEEVKTCEIETAAMLASGKDYSQDPAVVDLDIRQAGDTSFGGGTIARRLPARAVDALPPSWVQSVRGSGQIPRRVPDWQQWFGFGRYR